MSRTTLRTTGSVETVTASDGGITLSVPIRIKRRSGRKVITLPRGAESPCPTESVTSFQRAIARGFRWLRMIENGEVSSMGELARREHCDVSYVARMINLASLAPDIVAAILDETLPEETALLDLAINPPEGWEGQRAHLPTQDRPAGRKREIKRANVEVNSKARIELRAQQV